MTYRDNLGNTMIYEWWRGNRKAYFRLLPLLQMATTGSKNRSKWTWDGGPYPVTPKRPQESKP